MKQENIIEFKKSTHIGGSDPEVVDQIHSMANKRGLLKFLEEMSYSQLKELKVYGKTNAAMQESYTKTMDDLENKYSPHGLTAALKILVDSVYAGKHGVKALEDAKGELKAGIGKN